MKKLFVSLTTKGSIEKAVKALEEYKKELTNKGELFCRKLAEIGVQAAQMTLATKGSGDSSRNASFDVSFVVEGDTVKATLTITSTPHVLKDGRVYYPHLGWEFGAGIYYNNGNANPLASKAGAKVGVGTFPGQRHAFHDAWYYRDDAGNLRLSKGTEATMPMYTATIEMMNSIETIAMEVFGGK